MEVLMDKVQELVKLIRETKTQKDTQNISDADKLLNLPSDAAYEDKMRVAYDAESIWMLCSALEGVGRKVDV